MLWRGSGLARSPGVVRPAKPVKSRSGECSWRQLGSGLPGWAWIGMLGPSAPSIGWVRLGESRHMVQIVGTVLVRRGSVLAATVGPEPALAHERPLLGSSARGQPIAPEHGVLPLGGNYRAPVGGFM